VSGVVTTQDVSFGACWVRLIGARARWEPGSGSVPALDVRDDPPSFGAGLVAVWVADEGPVLVCQPGPGLRALKDFQPGVEAELLRNALRDAGVVVREYGPDPGA
jgi:hypothetical protein